VQVFLHVQALVLYKRLEGHYIHIGAQIDLLILLWHWFSCIKLKDGDSHAYSKFYMHKRLEG
jgi:hypothetical protein